MVYSYYMIMETAFDLLDETARSNFLRLLMQSFQCTYVCFWSYVTTPTNCLRFQDGIYHEEFNSQLASSSSGSFARRLFYEYQQSTFILHADQNDHIPGYAFRNSVPYWELQEWQLRRLASNEVQRQFYEEARIKTAVFIACKNGEIELGLSNVPTDKMKIEIISLFLPEDFQSNSNPMPTHDHQNPHYSSSSSSLRSLSNIDSPEYSSLLFNINNATSTSTSSQVQADQILPHSLQVNNNSPSLVPLRHPVSPSIAAHHEAMQAFACIRNPQFPNPESEEEAMTKAILAVLTSSLPLPPSTPSGPAYGHQFPLINTKSSAFKNYTPASLSTSTTSTTSLDHRHHHQLGRKKSMLKQSILFFQRLHLLRNRQTLQIPRPSNSTQLYHVMSERKRREKLNESFHALRSLLPPGTKKDKASLLNTTKEYLTSLKGQIEELSQRNKQLEAQIVPSSMAANNRESVLESHLPSDHERAIIDVRLRHHISEPGSDQDHHAKIVDLQVIVGAAIHVEDLVLSVLEFIKRVENVSLMSLESNTNNSDESRTLINRLTLRLRVVEGSEWDESAFEEAVRRVVANLAQ